MKLVKGETQLLHRTFVLSVGAKGIFGALELLGAIASFVISPAQIAAFATWATAKEIQEDPNAVVAQFILHLGTHIDLAQTHYVALYLALHGAVKVVLVVSLVKQLRWAYPAMFVALALFIVTQVVQLSSGFSTGLALLTAFDIFILALTWREWRLHKK